VDAVIDGNFISPTDEGQWPSELAIP